MNVPINQLIDTFIMIFKKPNCPECGSERIVKIVYGLLRGDMRLDETKYWGWILWRWKQILALPRLR